LAAAVAAKARGDGLNVTAVCAELGCSRKTFYKYLGRFRGEGVAGFFPRSRAPLRSPALTSTAVEDQIVRARKELDGRGQCGDNGALSIRWRLLDEGMVGVPARATIHRVLVRRGQVVPQPAKRPKGLTSRRFEASAPNDMWQTDGLDYRLVGGHISAIISVIDDHSRVDVAERAAPSENGADAVAAFDTAVQGYGLPRRLLSDNGSAFNGHRRGFTAALQARAMALGVSPISSSINHPQTCGKAERHHRTLLQWLARRPRAHDLAELQLLLDQFRPWYNNRRHQALGGMTPQERWQLADRVRPHGSPITPPPTITRPVVSPRGAVGVDGHEIGIGNRWAGQQTVVFRTGDHVTVFIGAINVRTLDLDRSRHYQPLGPPPAGPDSRPLRRRQGQQSSWSARSAARTNDLDG